MNKSNDWISNCVSDYNTYQLSLPLDLGLLIEPDDEVVSFLKIIGGMNLRRYLKTNTDNRGRKGYRKTDMLRTVLFAYMNGYYHTREIEKICKTDIRFMYLMQEERPSHNAFARFISETMTASIDDIFFDTVKHIIDEMKVSPSVTYIDGTKFEAYANKYTFVYKKRIINNRIKLFSKITEAIEALDRDFGYDYPVNDRYCAQEIGYIVQYLIEVIGNSGTELMYGTGRRKTEIQRTYEEFLGFYAKLLEYEYWLDVIGEARNSCSKTDHDATMGALKIDYYCNTGLSRPCYNAQIAVSDGIVINADLYQYMGDTNTFIPFLERHNSRYGSYPVFPVTDAGYGSYTNYMFAAEHDIQLVQKYGYYAKKNTAKSKKDRFNVLNWETSDGIRTCPQGKRFDVQTGDVRSEKGGYLSITQKLTCEESCEECPFRAECYRSAKDRRVISRNVVLEEFYSTVDANLETDFGKELKKQRSIQAEGAFGVIKEDMCFTRFSRRGMKNAKMEFLLVCLAYNFRKYHHYRLRSEGKKEETAAS